MASIAGPFTEPAREERFFSTMAIVMAAVVVIGFANQFLMGRSTFASPLRVHAHAVLFMGWVAIFVTQAQLATRGPIALHRRLGWLALGLVPLTIALLYAQGVAVAAAVAGALLTVACAHDLDLLVTIATIQSARAPFFFQPQHFLFADPLTLVCFVALTALAVLKRHQTDWHARLHIGAMALLTGPAFGRLLPMPLLVPYAFEAAGLATTVFLFAGMARDWKRDRAIHPAWWFGFAGLAVNLVGAQLLAHSAIGAAVYQSVVAGHPGERVPGLEFGTPPVTALRTGRSLAT